MKNFYVLVQVETQRLMTSVHCTNIGEAFAAAEAKAKAIHPRGYWVQAIAAQEMSEFWRAE